MASRPFILKPLLAAFARLKRRQPTFGEAYEAHMMAIFRRLERERLSAMQDAGETLWRPDPARVRREHD